MATYRISGVWKNHHNIITHYAFHTIGVDSTSRAIKTTKAEAIRLLEIYGNSASTWLWDYVNERWKNGAPVTVVNGTNGKFLRSTHDNKVSDNLAHLIDYDWIAP